MLEPVRPAKFRRDVRRLEKRGKDLRKLRRVLLMLTNEQALPVEYQDHPLKGAWSGWRDLHVEPDWVLIYRVEGQSLRLARTGTHADVFEE